MIWPHGQAQSLTCVRRRSIHPPVPSFLVESDPGSAPFSQTPPKPSHIRTTSAPGFAEFGRTSANNGSASANVGILSSNLCFLFVFVRVCLWAPFLLLLVLNPIGRHQELARRRAAVRCSAAALRARSRRPRGRRCCCVVSSFFAERLVSSAMRPRAAFPPPCSKSVRAKRGRRWSAAGGFKQNVVRSRGV